MLPALTLLDEMDEQMWSLLQRNLTGITEAEADWRPHPAANNVRWLVGHLAWFEKWAHDALGRTGRFLVDRDPTAYLDGTIQALLERFGAARTRYRARLAALDEADLTSQLSYFRPVRRDAPRATQDPRAPPGGTPIPGAVRPRHL